MAELLDQGLSVAAIATRLGITKPTVCYHKRRLGLEMNESSAYRYDWSVVQSYYEQGHSRLECMERFGFSNAAWTAAVNRGALVVRPRATPLEKLLVSDTPRGRWNIKQRLLAAGVKDGRCEECGIDSWRGKPLSLALHHVNGDGRDNRLENLVLLCPNCHSQTPNFGVNARKRRVTGGSCAPSAAAAA